MNGEYQNEYYRGIISNDNNSDEVDDTFNVVNTDWNE